MKKLLLAIVSIFAIIIVIMLFLVAAIFAIPSTIFGSTGNLVMDELVKLWQKYLVDESDKVIKNSI